MENFIMEDLFDIFNNRHSFRLLRDDGVIQRVSSSEIDTEEYSNDSSGMDNLLKHDENISKENKSLKTDLTPAGLLKRDLEESLDRGYENLSKSTKLRVLKELLKEYEDDFEDSRQSCQKVNRIVNN